MTIIINDAHIGFSRQGGTTPTSREALRGYLKSSLYTAIQEHGKDHTHLLIAGDLFDDFEVDGRDWLDAFVLLNMWVNSGNKLTLVAGNHDWSPRGDKVSSFQTLGAALSSARGGEVVVVDIDTWLKVEPGVIALAHCSNQVIFDQKLEEILAISEKVKHLVLHANFDNNFAAQSDHSLNVSRETARKFVEAGVTVLFAHEHQGRSAFADKVVCLGNQWPTSIADCLNNDRKCLHTLHQGVLTSHETWAADQSFSAGTSGFEEINWRELSQPTKAGFIRVTGTASSNEASDVINAIAAYRLKSPAFVITNATKIEGITEAAELPEQFEAAKRFDVMEVIRNHLNDDEMVAVERLIEKAQQ